MCTKNIKYTRDFLPFIFKLYSEFLIFLNLWIYFQTKFWVFFTKKCFIRSNVHFSICLFTNVLNNRQILNVYHSVLCNIARIYICIYIYEIKTDDLVKNRPKK